MSAATAGARMASMALAASARAEATAPRASSCHLVTCATAPWASRRDHRSREAAWPKVVSPALASKGLGQVLEDARIALDRAVSARADGDAHGRQHGEQAPQALERQAGGGQRREVVLEREAGAHALPGGHAACGLAPPGLRRAPARPRGVVERAVDERVPDRQEAKLGAGERELAHEGAGRWIVVVACTQLPHPRLLIVAPRAAAHRAQPARRAVGGRFRAGDGVGLRRGLGVR